MTDLKRGGFSEKWIYNALKSATTGYLKKVDKEQQSSDPGNMVNRPSASSVISRRYKKLIGKSMWFKEQPKNKGNSTDSNRPAHIGNKIGNRKAKPEAVLFVPHTPGGALKKLVQEVEAVANAGNKVGQVKIVERVGSKLTEQIRN